MFFLISFLLFDLPHWHCTGNEGSGLPADITSACDQSLFVESNPNVDLTMVDSLNVSAATAVILHSLLSQKRG